MISAATLPVPDALRASGRHIIALDGLRGVAAIAVMLQHSRLGERVALFGHGWLAVDFFLCLSRYVIGLAYDKRFAAGITFAAFAGLRVWRLYPMVLLGGLIGMVLFLATPQSHYCVAGHPDRLFTGAVSQLLLFPMVAGPCLFVFNIVFWSLFLELAANALHFAVFWKLGVRLLAGLAAVLGLVLAVAGMQAGWIQFGPWPGTVALGLVRCLFSYLLGYGLFRSRDRWTRQVPGLPFAAVAALLLAMLMIPPIGLHLPGSGALRPVLVIEELALVGLVFPAIVALGTASHVRGRWPAALGALSYPLYAIHLPLVYAVVSGFVAKGAVVFIVIRLVALAAIIALAWVVAVTIDLPINRLRHRAVKVVPALS